MNYEVTLDFKKKQVTLNGVTCTFDEFLAKKDIDVVEAELKRTIEVIRDKTTFTGYGDY